MTEFKQSEESKKRMEDCIRIKKNSWGLRTSEVLVQIYQAGMQDPQANAGLLEECEKFLIDLLVTCEDYSLYGTKGKTTALIEKIRERVK